MKTVNFRSVLLSSLYISIGLLALLLVIKGGILGPLSRPTRLPPKQDTLYSNLTLTHQIKVPARTRAIAISPDNKVLVSGGDEPVLRVLNIETGQLIQTLPNDDSSIVQFLEFGTDNDTIITGSNNRQISVWALKTGERTANFTVEQGDISDMAISGDGHTVMSTTYNGKLSAWNIDTGKPIDIPSLRSKDRARPFSSFANNQSQVWDIDLSLDGKNVAIASDQVRLLNLETGEQEIIGRNSFWSSIDTVKYSPDGKALVMLGDRDLQVWDLTEKKQIFKLSIEEDDRFFGELVLSADGRYAMMRTIQNRAQRGVPDWIYFKIWDLQTQRLLVTQPITGYELTFSPNGKIVVNTGGNLIKIWQ